MNRVKLPRKLRRTTGAKSFAQSGEDLIVKFALEQLRIPEAIYLDLGAHHPNWISNTYLFYSMGASGICVEPDAELIKQFRKRRKRDTVLDCAVGPTDTEATLYVMSESALNTMSPDDARRYTEYGVTIREERPVLVKGINALLALSQPRAINFVSLDIEGTELPVLQAIDFDRYRPEVFCIETIAYTRDKTERKNDSTIEFMLDNGYFVYGDTYINTIFVDGAAWRAR